MKKIDVVRRLYRYLIILMKHKKDRTPDYVGLTVCIGVIMGLFPIIGQSYLCILIWGVLRVFKIHFNLIATCAITFISNPFTTPFLFYLFYVTGQILLGENMVPFSSFVNQLNEAFKEGFSLKIILETLSDLLNGIAKPILLGYIPWGIIGGGLGYLIGYQAAVKWHLRHKKGNFKRKTDKTSE